MYLHALPDFSTTGAVRKRNRSLIMPSPSNRCSWGDEPAGAYCASDRAVHPDVAIAQRRAQSVIMECVLLRVAIRGDTRASLSVRVQSESDHRVLVPRENSGASLNMWAWISPHVQRSCQASMFHRSTAATTLLPLFQCFGTLLVPVLT